MLAVAHQTSEETPSLAAIPFVTNGFNSVSTQSLQSERTIEKRDYSAVDKASYRQRQGVLMADLLEESAEIMHNPRSLAVADCIRETASAENVYFSSDQTNFQTGECFDGYGVLTEAASSRLCPSYQARMSKRARKMVFAALHRVKANSDERLRFVTLTVPNLGASFERTMKVLDAAIVLLKKRQWFKRNFRGGIQSLETTIGEASHYHSHVHILAFSEWIVWERLGEEWTSCVREACRRFDVLLDVCTSHLRLVVDVRLVVGKSRGSRKTIGFEDAIQEVCKYVVKGSDWLKVPVEKLCEIERVLRGRKMVRTFGECSEKKSTSAESAFVFSRSDTAEIRDFSGADTYFNTTDTTDGSQAKPAQILKRETLIETGTRLIMDGKREEWLLLLRKKMRERRAWRRKQLLLIYPQAIFWTLDGTSFRNYENFDDGAENVVVMSDFRRRNSVLEVK
jgi:hypothetical protein